MALRKLLAIAAFASLAACGPPIQAGMIVVLPGSTERLMVAMEMGYRGVGEAKPPAQVRRATSNEDLALGMGATGKIGDYVLENGSVVAVVAAIDGSARAGTLVDVARDPRRIDELGSLSTTVLGEPVRYTTLKTGTDTATGAAFVEVSGLAGSLAVSTRYDLAPELDAVVVHTSFTRPHVDAASEPRALDIADEIALAPGALRHWSGEELKSALAAFGSHAAYAIVPLGEDDPSTALERISVRRSADANSATIGLTSGHVPEGLFVYSRMVAPLERADSLALSSALAVASGQELGDVEVEVSPERRTTGMLVPPGTLLFHPPGDAPPVELAVTQSLHAGDTVTAKVPAGAWDVSFVSEGLSSPSPVHVTVHGRQLSAFNVVSGR